MPWAEDEAPAAPAPAPTGRWATSEEEVKPALPKPPSEPTMPGPGEALLQGIGAGIGHTKESVELLAGKKRPGAEPPPSPAAAPLEWSDVKDIWGKLAPKLTYGLGQSSPTLAGGLAGGLAGAATPVPGGALIGGAGGAGLGAALQEIGPYFGEELKKSPDNPDDAWTRALQRAGASGVFSAAGWAAFPLKIAQGPLKNLAFQVFGVQAPKIGRASCRERV